MGRGFRYKMATNSDNPTNDVDEDYISMSLHEMFHIVGDQMTERDIKLLKFFCVGLISEEMTSKVHDGFSFLLCMEKMNLVSESNFMNVLDLLRIINRHDLSQFVHLRCRKTVRRDPICEYLESNFTQSQSTTDKSEVFGGSSLVQDNVTCNKSVSETTGRDGGKSSVKTAVSESTTEPCKSISHCKSSRTKTSDSNSSCQLAPSPSSSMSSSTLTSVCSSSRSLLPGERCVQRSSSSDVPSMSTRSKRLRSGDFPEASGGSEDSPSTSHKRRRKDVELKGNTEVHDHSTTDTIQVDRQSVMVAAGQSVQERMASDDSNRTSKSVEKKMASPSDINTSQTVQSTRASSCDSRDTECVKAPEEGQINQTTSSQPGDSGVNAERKKEKLTCDIRLRVRAEVALQESTLEGNVFSNKPTVVERQCEKFMQANTVLKSHDLGSIVCDIKFSDLTYLDAFWRDYINGSLLEALKGVFLTESLKQAVGHEAIKLLVNVDEDDYEAGRVKLLQNLKN